jgi:hypothetical protein
MKYQGIQKPVDGASSGALVAIPCRSFESRGFRAGRRRIVMTPMASRSRARRIRFSAVVQGATLLLLGGIIVACGPTESDVAGEWLDEAGKFDSWDENGRAGMDRDVLDLALLAARAAREKGYGRKNILAVLDFSLPSSEKRLWVLDLAASSVLYNVRAAHGRNSGDQLNAESFSNRDGSNMSSLGLFECAETGVGSSVGYYVALDGLEPGYNDNARRREILVHGSSYVTDEFYEANGYVGRSLGCVAVSSDISDDIVDTLSGGALLFAYYPDDDWLSHSAFLGSPSGGEPARACTNTCYWARDGECDDGGPGAMWEECTYGTDCADCGPR